jgi:YVTN family beta-propeller protein
VGQGPCAAAYDPKEGHLFVANSWSNNTTIINGTTNTVIGSIPVGSAPVAFAYDSRNGYLYIADEVSDNLTVVNGANDHVVGSIPVGSSPDAVAFDNASGYLYVANYGSNNVSVINAATGSTVGTLAVGLAPDAVVYDDANQLVYIANGISGTVSITCSSCFSVIFNETGLPARTLWSITLTASIVTSSQTSLEFTKENGTYFFQVGTVPGYRATPLRGYVEINGANVSTPIAFVANATGGSLFLGLPFTEGIGVMVGLLLTVLVIGAVVGWLRLKHHHKTRPPRSEPPSIANPPSN